MCTDGEVGQWDLESSPAKINNHSYTSSFTINEPVICEPVICDACKVKKKNAVKKSLEAKKKKGL